MVLKEYLSVAEAIKFMSNYGPGVNLSHALTDNRRGRYGRYGKLLPYVRVGRLVYYLPDDLIEFVDAYQAPASKPSLLRAASFDAVPGVAGKVAMGEPIVELKVGKRIITISAECALDLGRLVVSEAMKAKRAKPGTVWSFFKKSA